MIWISIAGLVLVFAAAAMRPVNIGLAALAAAFLVGVIGAGISPKDVLGGFPGDLLITLLGVTYLFAMARDNGTIDLVIDWAARMTGYRAKAMPVLVFAVAGILTAFGALGPAAVAIIAPIGLRLARQYRISALLMGLATIHGAQAGAFSPMSVYGGITNQVMERNGMQPWPEALFLASLAVNAVIAAVVYLMLSRSPVAEQPVAGLDKAMSAAHGEWTATRKLTLCSLLVVAVGALVFKLDIGLLAITIIVALAIIAPRDHAISLGKADWSTIVLITGVVTYVGVMDRLGAIEAVGSLAGAVAVPLIAVLIICYLAGVISAFASSTALLGVVVPMAAPIIAGGHLSPVAVVAAIAISTTIVDTSPFSTNGALVVANAEPDEQPRVLQQMLRYTAIIVALGPLFAWACIVLAWGR